MLPAIPEKASCTVRGTCSNIVDFLAVNWPDKVNDLVSQVALELLTSILRVMTLAWLDFPLAPDSTINHLILSLIAARFQTPFFPIWHQPPIMFLPSTDNWSHDICLDF